MESTSAPGKPWSPGRNAATVRLAFQVGLEPVKQLAQRAGIASPLRDAPSTFLGSSEVKLDEMCLAYSCFPNKGRRPKELSLIRRITDVDGKVIFQVKDDEDDMVEVMDEMAAYQTHSCLVDALTRGTGKVAYDDYNLKKFPAGRQDRDPQRIQGPLVHGLYQHCDLRRVGGIRSAEDHLSRGFQQ